MLSGDGGREPWRSARGVSVAAEVLDEPLSRGRLFMVAVLASLVALGATCGSARSAAQREVASLAARPEHLSLGQSVVSVQGFRLSVDSSVTRAFPVAVDSFRALLPGSRSASGRSGLVRLARVGTPCRRGADACNALSHAEGFWLSVQPDSVLVVGADSLGILHGMAAVGKLIRKGGGRLSSGSMASWPHLRVRALHFSIDGLEASDAERLIWDASQNQFNTVILQLGKHVVVPGFGGAGPGAWDPATLEEVVRYARQSGLQVVPEIKLLSHQEKLFKDIRNGILLNPWTYDPSADSTYAVVFRYLDQIISMMHPKAIHIGHDEVAGVGGAGPKNADLKKVLPAHLFLVDVDTLHSYLAARGIRTWMWGDMFLQKQRYPHLFQQDLHGTPAYAALLDSIPKDVVLCDWHYYGDQTSFFSASAFARAGHQVLGATWKNPVTIGNFSRYIADLGPHGLGMIATTWSPVQQRQWNVVDGIVSTSGRDFWAGGPGN